MATKEELELVVGKEIKNKKELWLHRIGVGAFLLFLLYKFAVQFGWIEGSL